MSACKWVGGVLGFMLLGGSPLGALIGWWLGSKLDEAANDDTQKLNDSNRQGGWGDRGFSSQNKNASQFTFQMGLLALMAAVMKADGEQKRSELDKIKEFIVKAFPTEKDQKNALMMLKSFLSKNHIDVDGIATEIRRNLDIAKRRELVHFLLGVGYSDGDLDYREENLIRHISVLLGLPTREYEAIKITFQHTNSDYRGSQQQNYGNQGSSYQRSNNSNTTYHTESTDWAYTQLGITKAATDEDVKKAYRSMAKKFHPDRVANLGEAVVKEANIRFRKINEAYETIKKERGIS